MDLEMRNSSEDTFRLKGRCTLWIRRTLLERCLICACLGMFIVLSVLMGVVIHDKHGTKNRLPSVCTSPECTIAAEEIINSMDTSVDPCEDFYNFSCGSYLKKFESDVDVYSRTLRRDSGAHINRLARELLERSDDQEEFEFTRKVKKYYRSCVNNTQKVPELIKEFLEKSNLKAWPILKDDENLPQRIEKTLAIVNIYGRGNPFLRVDRDENSTLAQMKLSPGWSIMSDEVLLNTTDVKCIGKKKKYEELLEFTLYQLGVLCNDTHTEVEEIIEFETKLANVTSIRKEDEETVVTSIKEFTSNCSAISWSLFVRILYSYFGYDDDFEEDMPVSIKSLSTLLQLCELLAETSNRTMHNYLVWNVLVGYLVKINPSFEKTFREVESYLDVYRPHLRWRRCVYFLIFNELEPGATYLILKHLKPERTVEEARKMAIEIKKSIDVTLSKESWLNSKSKEIARRKLKNIEVRIGYSNGSTDVELLEKYFSQFNVTESFLENMLFISQWSTRSGLFNDSFMFSRQVKFTKPILRYGYYKGDAIEIPLGNMESSHFKIDLPKYYNYGGLGFVTGHEFMHAFDNLGFEKDAKYEWPEETIERFKQKKQCFINQYSKFRIGNSDIMVNGTSTAKENIADTTGILHALKAYENFHQEHGDEPYLPGLDFTNEQVFFIRIAQEWCQVFRSEEKYFRDSSHSPARYRIIGPLQNIPQFSKAFSCSPGTTMNPRNKCKIYG